MELTLIIAIIVFAAAVFLIYKLTKAVVKTILFVFALLAVISIIFGFFVFRDVMDIKENFQTAKNTFLIDVDGKITAGIITSFAERTENPEEPSGARLNEYNSAYQAKDFKSMLGDSYKLFIFKEEAFDSVQQIIAEEKNYTRDYILSLLKSETPVDDFIADEATSQPEARREQYMIEAKKQINMTDAQFKGLLFAMLLQTAMEEGKIFMIKEYKEDNLVIYPETITFKLLKLMPRQIMNRITSMVGG